MKPLIAALTLLVSASAFAEGESINSSQVIPAGPAQARVQTALSGMPAAKLRNSTTGQVEDVSVADMQNPAKLEPFVANIPGALDVYNAYIRNGYMPFHAYLLANWDAVEAVRSLKPDTPKNPMLAQKIEELHSLYKPAN
ncbi:hypothetical protein ACYPKM_03215 [Pseudomonas aeruginosa]